MNAARRRLMSVPIGTDINRRQRVCPALSSLGPGGKAWAAALKGLRGWSVDALRIRFAEVVFTLPGCQEITRIGRPRFPCVRNCRLLVGPGSRSASVPSAKAAPAAPTEERRGRRPELASGGRTPCCRSRSCNQSTTRTRCSVRTCRTRAGRSGTGTSGPAFRRQRRFVDRRRQRCPRTRRCASAAAWPAAFKSSWRESCRTAAGWASADSSAARPATTRQRPHSQAIERGGCFRKSTSGWLGRPAEARSRRLG